MLGSSDSANSTVFSVAINLVHILIGELSHFIATSGSTRVDTLITNAHIEHNLTALPAGLHMPACLILFGNCKFPDHSPCLSPPCRSHQPIILLILLHHELAGMYKSPTQLVNSQNNPQLDPHSTVV